MADILLVDDDPASRAEHARLLDCAGHEIALAATGTEALDRLRHAGRRFDAIVTDLLLPDTDGFELIAAIRRLAPSLPVIAIANGGSRIALDLARFAEHLGADRILRKPVTAAVLLAAVARLLGPGADR
jgi:CheY-like chemotaxis protein